MTTISDFLAPDHIRCDIMFAEAESAVAKCDWEKAAIAFNRFQEALMHHFTMEETVMFPAFEARTGMTQGPTSMMRSEHSEMTDLVGQMSNALSRKDANDYLGIADTLLIIMRQHNIKEEQVLYQMADQALAGELDAVVKRMNTLPMMPCQRN